MMKKHCNPIKFAHALFSLALVAAVLAAVVFFAGMEALWNLAGTQWLLVSIALGVFAANLHMCKDCVKSGGCTCGRENCTCAK